MNLDDLLGARDVLLADGAMGTSLFERGLETGDSPELWNVIHPERVIEVHRGFVDAGADLVLTNSFGANRFRLKLHDLETRAGELNRAAVEVARAAAAEVGRPVLVAGSIGPTGEILAPLGACPAADAADAFAEQAEALAADRTAGIVVASPFHSPSFRAGVRGAEDLPGPLCLATNDGPQGLGSGGVAGAVVGDGDPAAVRMLKTHVARGLSA